MQLPPIYFLGHPGLMTLLALILAVPFSYALTAAMRRYGLAARLLDHPNERSSHSIPTPRGGGVAIVVTTTAGMLLLGLAHIVDSNLALAMIGGGIMIATVGFMDDRGSMSVAVRLAVHAAAAIWATFILGGLPPISFGHHVVTFGIYGSIVGALAIIWALNLFNFMDGIDGIAASEAIFVSVAGAILAWHGGLSQSTTLPAVLIAFAALGFLFWNWPPARIFMGDVGSGYLGYVIGVMALAVARENGIALFQWLILGGVFFTDATVTLLRRLIRGEKVHAAHRSHAYQWLARRWRSHLRVTISVWVVNIFWLLPCAWLAASAPGRAWLITLAALAPLVLVAPWAGSGRREPISPPANE